MRKTILASVIGATAFTALMSGQALAQDFYYRYPIANASNDDGSGGSTGPGTGQDGGVGSGGDTGDGSETDPTTDPTYCDLDQDLVDQWSSAGVSGSSATDNGLFESPTYFFTSGTNGLDGTQFPKYPSKCFNTITMYNTIGGLDFLTTVTKGDFLSLGSIRGGISDDETADFSGVRNIVELNEFNVNPDLYPPYLENLVKIPQDAWLCQPEQEAVFTGLSQDKLCDFPEEEVVEEEVVLGPWPQFAEDNNLPYSDWNDTEWFAEGLTYIPTEPYPITSLTGDIMLYNNDITDITGFSQITNIDGWFDISGNNIKSLNPISNLVVGGSISISSSYSGDRLASDTIFCEQNDASQFRAAEKSDVCVTQLGEINANNNIVYGTLHTVIRANDSIDYNKEVSILLSTSKGEIQLYNYFDTNGHITYNGANNNYIDISSIYVLNEDLNMTVTGSDINPYFNDVVYNTTIFMGPRGYMDVNYTYISHFDDNLTTFNITNLNLDYTNPIEYEIYLVDGSGNKIANPNNIVGDIYINDNGEFVNLTSNAVSYNLGNGPGPIKINTSSLFSDSDMSNVRLNLKAYDIDNQFMEYDEKLFY